jgi:hypothetical protein
MTKKTRVLTPEQQLARLLRIRWAARGVLALGVAASVMANVLHADPHPISQSIAAWPPLALLITVEFILPIPVHRRWLANIRLIGTALIAGIAAWVSYWHMVGVVLRYGESADVAYLLPLSVDGLVVVASVSLVELSGNIRALTTTLGTPDTPPHITAATATLPAPDANEPPEPLVPAVSKAAAEPSPRSVPAVPLPRQEPAAPVPHNTAGRTGQGSDVTTSPALLEELPQQERPATGGKQASADGQPPTDTAAAVAYWHRHDPTLSIPEVADKIGKSARTVRRYWPSPVGTPPPAAVTTARRP